MPKAADRSISDSLGNKAPASSFPDDTSAAIVSLAGAHMDTVNRATSRDEKLRSRCSALAEIIRRLRPQYEGQNTTVDQRHFIETIVGAALWYLPKTDGLWTRLISERALSEFHPDSGIQSPRLTDDHEYPRKYSAMMLMRQDWEGADPCRELMNLYTSKYGRYNKITPQENRALVKFQRTAAFNEPEQAYKSAEITLMRISDAELLEIKKRKRDTIETILAERSPESGDHPRP